MQECLTSGFSHRQSQTKNVMDFPVEPLCFFEILNHSVFREHDDLCLKQEHINAAIDADLSSFFPRVLLRTTTTTHSSNPLLLHQWIMSKSSTFSPFHVINVPLALKGIVLRQLLHLAAVKSVMHAGFPRLPVTLILHPAYQIKPC